MKMSIKIIASSLLICCLSIGVIEAATRTDTISRGQTKGWMVSPGDPDVLDVYYSADGRGAIAEWWQGFPAWLAGWAPTIFTDFYYYSMSRGWVYLWTGTADPWSQHFDLLLSSGTYLIRFRIYQNPTGGSGHQINSLSLKIR